MKITKKSALQFVKYNVGGLAFFWSAWLIITFGTKYIGLWRANLAGNLVGISLNYLVQRYWAFGTKKPMVKIVFVKYVVLTIANFFIGYYILLVLTKKTSVPLWAAQFVSAGFFTFWNYILYRFWVFRGTKK